MCCAKEWAFHSMSGRDKFAKYNSVIRLIEAFYGCFPKKFQRWLFNHIRGRKGNWGIVSRYALIRNLAQECGDNVVIDENVYIFNIHNISFGCNVSVNSMCYIDGFGGITIGNNVSIAHGSTIMSSSHKYQGLDTPIKYQGIDAAPVYIEDNVWIGAKATILYGRRVASGSIVGANSVVTKDIGINEIWGGSPARKIKNR